MHPRLLLSVLLVTFCCAQSGCSSASTAAGAGAPAPTKLDAVKSLIPTLTPGMSAETIRQKLGNPDEIKPMDSSQGKAEVWIFHLEKTVGTTQVASSTKDIPAFGAPLSLTGISMVPEPVYTLKEDKALITLSLLMFNGQLAAQKAKVDHSADYK